MGIKFTFDSVNRIKCEKWNEFEGSIFSEAYGNAHSLIEKIIGRNQKYGDTDRLDKFCNENQIFNVISFLGERGMGKSSAMLSFAFSLKEYTYNGMISSPEYGFDSFGSIDFHVLSKIDAAMMVKGESLFDIVLAKMWDEFSIKANKGHISKDRADRTKEKFTAVKAGYTEYWKVMSGDKKLKAASQLTELHELSQSLNLRQSFAELVQDFLECWKTEGSSGTYLVIPIDDLDMVKDDIYNKLEQIRLFFTIPHMVILVTADINRLSLDLSGMFSKQMLCEFNVREREKKMVREYAENYLAKVLPRNMRIYMPFFDGMDGNLLLLGYGDYLEHIYIRNPEEEFTENKFTLAVLAKCMRILMYPDMYARSVERKSLRNIVNSVSELQEIIKVEKNYLMLYQWIKKELSISCQGIEEVQLADFIQKLIHAPEDRYNFYLVNWKFTDNKCLLLDKKEKGSLSNNMLQNNPGYGKALSRILKWQQIYFQDNEFGRLLIWVYSVQIGNALQEGRDIEDIFIRGDIFGSLLKDINEKLERERNVSFIFSMDLKEGKSSFEKILLENETVIYSRFLLLLLCDAGKILDKVEVIKNKVIEGEASLDLGTILNRELQGREVQDQFHLEVGEIYSKVSIDNFFKNAVIFDELWKKYINWLSEAVSGKKIPKYENTVNVLKVGEKLRKFNMWKNKYSVRVLNDILPVQNVGVMVEIARRLKQLDKKKCDNIKNYADQVVNIVVNTYQEVEEYYYIDHMRGGVYRHSIKLRELYDIVNFEDMNDKTLDNNLTNAIYVVNDTSV